MDKQEKIQHFGVWIKKSDGNKISRDNYAIIDKKCSTWSPRIADMMKAIYKTPEERQKHYDDAECKIYSDSFCEEWRKKCLANFDLNMAFFHQISKEDFEDKLQKLLKSNKKIRQIFDLDECKGKNGIYIMVLDEYKQAYIGQSQDIRRRIMQHWSNRKPFDRLIFGNANHSVLSIDCFGALDTTRIYVLETTSFNTSEKIAVNKMPPQYRLNRIGGGTVNNTFDFLEVLSEFNSRNFGK